jgi:biopolymer transport protein ExbB
MAVVVGGLLLMASAAMAQPAAAEPAAPAKDNSIFHWFIMGAGEMGYVLIGLSVVSMALIIEHFMSVRRSNILPETSQMQITQMLEAKQYRELITFTSSDTSLLSYILNKALAEAPHGYGAMEHAMEQALAQRVSKMVLKPEILGILGNTGPLLGLLGTVMGIVLAFRQICMKGGIPEPGELSGSIGVALVATFWGLMVAIPSLIVYAVMKNRIDAYAGDALSQGRDFLQSFRAGSKKRAEAGSAA